MKSGKVILKKKLLRYDGKETLKWLKYGNLRNMKTLKM